MATCNINELLAEADGLTGLTSGQRRIVIAKLLYDYAGETASVLDLLSDASCFLCLTQAQLRLVQAQLLCNISGGGGGYQPPAAFGDIPNDSFEDYSTGQDLEGLNGGENGQNPFVILWESQWQSSPYGNSQAAVAPNQVANLELWVKADQITGVNNNDPLGQWDDVSGNARHFTAAGAARPTYQTNIQNGLPGVNLTEVAGIIMAGALNIAAAPYTVIVVYRCTNLVNAATRPIVEGANPWFIAPSGLYQRLFDGDFRACYQMTSLALIFGVTRSAAPVTRGYINGGEGNQHTVAGNLPGTLHIGSATGNAGAIVFEIAAYSRALPPEEMFGLALSLGSKWGI